MLKTEKNKGNTSAVGNLTWEVMRRKLEKELPAFALNQWIDHFELAELDDARAVISFSGNGDLAEFREKYYDTFANSLCWALGRKVELEFIREETQEGDKLFRTCLFGGYNKKDVMHYIRSLQNEIEKLEEIRKNAIELEKTVTKMLEEQYPE